MTFTNPKNSESCPSDELRFLDLLAQRFPTIADAATEIVNLEAILNLPKGTEHFLTDLHGEAEAFRHVLKNASGVIRQKVDELFGHTLREAEKRDLCTLIYYPEEKLERVKRYEEELDDWYRITLNQLVEVCRYVSTKYTRSKVYKALPADFSYIIQELLHESGSRDMPNKQDYFNAILNSIIEVDRADEFITAISRVIQQLTIDRLHIIGDIFDRAGPHIILDTLSSYHNVDIQWGNHDILWMGAAAGNEASLATSCASRPATPTSTCWKTATVSICCRWRGWQWRSTATTHARVSRRACCRTAVSTNATPV